MKKRRGKQPVKPNLEEAMKDRVISLKGVQYSTMNIPIIYRRTFGWNEDTVLFKPMNRRSFVVLRSGLENEEMDLDHYTRQELDLKCLPWYCKNRKHSQHNEEFYIEELRELLISYSLTDRYVHIDVLKPADAELNACLRHDLEYLSGQLGYQYSITKDAYRCTFIFPKLSNDQNMKKCSQAIQDSIALLQGFNTDLKKHSIKAAHAQLQDLVYSVDTTEANIDRLHTESLNIAWDLPQTEPIGYFLLIQECERAYDEIQYLVNSSLSVVEGLMEENGQAAKFLWERFKELWNSSIAPTLQSLSTALETLVETELSSCLEILRKRRQEKEQHDTPQSHYVSELTKRIGTVASRAAESGQERLLMKKAYVEVIHDLFGMNQAAERIMGISADIATMNLYLKNS